MEHIFENDTGKWGVTVIDSTHINIRFFEAPVHSGFTQHIGQLTSDVKAEISKLGLIEGNFFKTDK